jgi:hypothetical protein
VVIGKALFLYSERKVTFGAMMKALLGPLTVLLLLFSCQSDSGINPKQQPSLFTLLSSKKTGVKFRNDLVDGKDFNILTYRNFYNGGGIAIGDINQDGLEDLFFTSNLNSNRLYLNKGNLVFEDITDAAGVGGNGAWSTGATMADVNQDGFLDIYVCNSGYVEGDDRSNELFINKGDLSFSEQSEDWGLKSNAFSMQAAFFDYDQDGDLDCFLLNNSLIVPSPKEFYEKSRMDVSEEGGDKLYRNDGDSFIDVTLQAGIFTSDMGFGLGVSVSDLNQDMLPDIYVSNDFWERDYLYINQGDGTFSEELDLRLGSTSLNSMGTDIADLNNDGAYDIMTTDMLPGDNFRNKTMTVFDSWLPPDSKYRAGFHYQLLQNSLQLNDGRGGFQELGHQAGVTASDWSWGALIFDFDNNGWKDIFISNAIFHEMTSLDFTEFLSDRKNIDQVVAKRGEFDWRDFAVMLESNPLSNYAFVNDLHVSGRPEAGEIPSFKNKAQELGLGEPSFSNGAAYGDLDKDGDLDLVINNVNMEAFVIRNNSTNNYLKIAFEGKEGNGFGEGAQVRIKYGQNQQTLQNYATRSFQSSVGTGLIFGLGSAAKIDELEVIWANGDRQILNNIAANQVLVLKQSDATETYSYQEPEIRTLFKEADLVRGDHRHTENSFNDFEQEILLHRMLSTEGPVLIKGDVNGDGLEDVVLGGATNDPDKLFIQDRLGRFNFSSGWASLAEADRSFETSCGTLSDLDGDGDLDLLVGAGGNEFMKGTQGFELRFYENTGQGSFIKNENLKPPAFGNFSCIEPEDIDQDGDMDLFIGARIVPGNYGLLPRSYLLRNEGSGRWSDITTKEIGTAGMITDAAWSDVDGDGDRDLVLVGDWMPVKIFENQGGMLSFNGKLSDPALSGWWNTIEAADLDQDGDDDYILGNWGLNSKFKASRDRPLTMYVKDFDNNGKSEFIINWFAPIDDRAYPFNTRDDLLKQIPMLNKSNSSYVEFANKEYETLLSPELRQNAIPFICTYMESSVYWNTEQGLKMEALPPEAQVSPVFAIVAEDLDGDGNKDLWLGGNLYGLKPEVGYNNASKGIFLQGSKHGFSYISPAESGIQVRGEARDACTFSYPDGLRLMVARNNEGVLVFEQNKD